MSLTCKLPQFEGRLTANLTLKKTKESNCVKKWRRKVMFFWIFGGFFCVVIVLWLLLGFNGGTSDRVQTELVSCNGKAKTLFIHRNVSRDVIYAFASLFSDSNQVTSFRCSKESSLETLANNEITCDLEECYLERRESKSCYRRVAEPVKREAQCFTQHRRLPWKLDPSVFQLFFPSAAPRCMNLEQNLLPSTESKDHDKEHCEILSLYLTRGWWCLLVGILASFKISSLLSKSPKEEKEKTPVSQPVAQQRLSLLQQQQRAQAPSKGAGRWRKKLLILFVLMGILTSVWLFWHLNEKIILRRKETLANMCDERARMLQDQFNVSMNHVHALAILVSTFHHGKRPSAMDQKTFGEYTERTNFERPLTSGVAYALKVLHSERDKFEREHGWTIKKMETENQTLVQDCVPENLDPAPVQDEYAPVIFSQETVSHIVSIDMMSGKEDHENILRARATGKGVLTSPFKLLKSNHLGVVLTFAVYNANLPHDATEEQRIKATVGYLGASYDVPSLVEKLLHQLASKQTIVVNVYDTTDPSAPIKMYGSEEGDKSQQHTSNLDFGDPLRNHEMHCWFKQKPPAPWTAIISSAGVLVITLLVGHIFYAAINRIAKVEEDCQKMMELKARAEAADVAKSQFLATVSHEIRTPMNGVLGMLQMLMDTDLDANQLDYAQTAHASGKDLISLINEVLDQAKIESGRLELENVPFDLRFVLDNVLSLFSGKSNEKGIELSVYVSSQVPDVLIGDPGRFRQIITNLVGNSIKFTNDKGHIFVSVHIADEVRGSTNIIDEVLKQRLGLALERSGNECNTLSGYPVVNTWRSWRKFRTFNSTVDHGPEKIELLVTVEDTGVGIPLDAQERIFTPFMQADSSTSRTYGGTGIGLSISKRLVELMQGEIGFVSEPGTGSTFSFTGIFRKADTKSSATKWQQYDPVVQEFQGSRALVIDNRRVRAEVTRYHLRRLGISVDITSTVRTACACASKFANLAMVVIDKDVWDKEEFAAFHERLNDIQETSTGFPKVFLLATSASPVERNELKSSGFIDDVVLKPLRVSVFIGCLQEALGNGKNRQTKKKNRGNLGHLLKAKRILVVDDNLVNRRVAEGALKKYGAVVKCVDSGKAALAMLRPPHNFDACFMDLQMPEMDGFEATRKVRILEKEMNEKIASGEALADMLGNMAHWHVPILAMTADVIQATSEECMKCGMDDYVSKPFEEEQLYTAVARFFESG